MVSTYTVFFNAVPVAPQLSQYSVPKFDGDLKVWQLEPVFLWFLHGQIITKCSNVHAPGTCWWCTNNTRKHWDHYRVNCSTLKMMLKCKSGPIQTTTRGYLSTKLHLWGSRGVRQHLTMLTLAGLELIMWTRLASNRGPPAPASWALELEVYATMLN